MFLWDIPWIWRQYVAPKLWASVYKITRCHNPEENDLPDCTASYPRIYFMLHSLFIFALFFFFSFFPILFLVHVFLFSSFNVLHCSLCLSTVAILGRKYSRTQAYCISLHTENYKLTFVAIFKWVSPLPKYYSQPSICHSFQWQVSYRLPVFKFAVAKNKYLKMSLAE
jgi:hypothetical protein